MNRRTGSLAFAIPVVAAMICLLSSGAALAQTASSTLVGTVVDGTGAIVPGATVTATHIATTTIRNGTSNEAGLFRLPALAPGEYSVVVELAGFKSVTVQQIQLVSSETRDLGKLALQVGTQTESVTVTADVTPIQFASAERSATVTGDQLQNIQLKGRDVFGFTSILPGILDTNNSRDFTTWTSMRDISINGAPSGSKNVTIDGVNVIDEGANQNAFVNPNIDAVSEVRVLTNGFQAEYGRNAGGTINIITKGGTNQLHASGWYNARRDKWNANDFIRNARNQPKPVYKVNISGYSIGGPLVIPKVTSGGSRRLFFFASQEFTNDARPVTPVIANLPTALERAGDFSETRQTNGQLLVVRDPQTGQPFPGNRIPLNRINPTGRAILNLLPAPNGYTNPVQPFTANFLSQNTPVHNRRDDVIRVDANLTDRTSMYVKYIRDREDTISYDAVTPGVGSLLNFVPGWLVTGHVTQVLSNTMVNEITVGYGHNNFGNRRPDGEDHSQYFRSALGVNPPRLEALAQVPSGEPVIAGLQNDEWPYLPIFTFTGGNRINLPGYFAGTTNGGGRVLPQANRNDRVQIQDDLSKTWGRHNLKTGAYVEYSSKTEPNIGSNYLGNFNFGSTPDNPLDTGYGYANALLGVFQQYTESPNRANPDMRQWQIEGYVQDNWRVNSRFTMDYGLRLYHSGPYSDQYANAGFFEEAYSRSKAPRMYRPFCTSGAAGNQACPAAQQRAIDPLTGQIVPFAFQGTYVPGSGETLNGIQPGGRTGKGDYYDYPPIVVAPRIGFAWDVRGNGKTSLRASGGTFYNRVGKGGYNAFLVSSAVVQDKVIRYGVIDDIPNLARTAIVSPVSGVGRAGLQRDLERAYEANVTIQHDLGFNTMVEAAYVMNLVRRSQQNNEVNPIPLYAYGNPANLFNNAPINANFLRTAYPGLGSVVDVVTNVDSLNYHGLQMQVQRRLSRGLQFGVAYTFSKAEGIQGWDPYTQDIRERYYGPTATDRRHLLSVNYSYLIPGPADTGSLLNRLLGDWQISGITKFQTGAPATPGCTSNNAGIANSDPSLTGLGNNAITGVRCQLVGDPFSGFEPGSDLSTARQFNTAAFSMAQPLSATVGNFGDAPIGILRQPSWSNWDMTLAKRIRAGRTNVRLQFQAYNVFNQAEFTQIGTTFAFTGANNSVNNNADTGRYTVVNPGRQVGITARFEF